MASGPQRRLAQAAEPKWYPGGGRAKDSSGGRRPCPLLGDLIEVLQIMVLAPRTMNNWRVFTRPNMVYTQ